MKTSKSCTNIP